jgi:hypothetical protein
MEEAYAVLVDQPPDAELAHLAAQIGRLCGMIGEEARGREPLERAIEISETLHLPEVLSHALNTKGLWMIAFTNRREEARSLMLGALRVALEGDAPYAAMRAYFNLSFEREGVDDHTHDYDTRGLAMAERAGDQQWKRSFLLHTSFAAVERGDWDEALRITHEAQETPGAETDVFARGILLTRAVILARRGAVADARAAIAASGFDESDSDEQNRAQLWLASAEALAGESRFAEAAAIARRGADGFATLGLGHPAVKESFILESWCEFHAGDRPAAEASLQRLEDLPSTGGSPRLLAHRSLMRALLAEGDAAEVQFAEAVDSARRSGTPWQLAITLGEQAAAGYDRDPSLAEAREILERLCALAALERIASRPGEHTAAIAAG